MKYLIFQYGAAKLNATNICPGEFGEAHCIKTGTLREMP